MSAGDADDYYIQKGARVRLVYMAADPDPIPSGSEGIVYYVSPEMEAVDTRRGSRRAYRQIGVSWDNGRSLTAICPPDQLEVLG